MPTPIENHEKWSRRFELVLSNPSKIAEMDNSKVGETVETCVGRLRRVRMGGRSTPLYVLAILLWHAHDRSPRIQVDVEELLALALRISLDPSFVQPEWAIVLLGVLIARYEGDHKDREEVFRQCRLNLRYLERSSTATIPVRRAAARLLECWDATFQEGLDPVIQAGRAAWPESSSISNIQPDRLEEMITEMNEILPASLTDRERRLYRLHFERNGIWDMLGRISLR